MGTAHAAITIFFTPLGGIKTSLGAAIGTTTSFIRTKALTIGDDMTYFIDKIISHITDSSKQTRMTLEISGSDDEDGPFELLDIIDLSLEDPGYSDPPGRRFYEFKFVDIAVRERWQLHGFDVFGEAGGDEF